MLRCLSFMLRSHGPVAYVNIIVSRSHVKLNQGHFNLKLANIFFNYQIFVWSRESRNEGGNIFSILSFLQLARL